MWENTRLSDMLISALFWSLFGVSIVYSTLEWSADHVSRLFENNSVVITAYNVLFGFGFLSDIFFGFAVLFSMFLYALYMKRLRTLNEVLKFGRIDRNILGLILVLLIADFAVAYVIEGVALQVTNQTDLPVYRAEFDDVEISQEMHPLSDAFVSLIAAPLDEEFMFRGVLLGVLLARGWNVALAVALTAAVFAITHVQYYFSGMLMVFVSGLVFGILRVISGGLAAPILAHVLLNGVIILLELADV